MYKFKAAGYTRFITLSYEDMLLLNVICNLGFVNSNQLNMLYAVSHRSPTVISKSILYKWRSYGALLYKREKTRVFKRNVYLPTKRCRKFLIDNGFDVEEKNSIQVNSHNEQAIEVVVQSLYAAVFDSFSLGSSIPHYSFDTSYVVLDKPEKLIKSTSKPDIQSEARKPENSTRLKARVLTIIEPNRLYQIANQIKYSKDSIRSSTPATSASIDTLMDKLDKALTPYALPTALSISTAVLSQSLLDGTISTKDITNALANLPLSKQAAITDNDTILIRDTSVSTNAHKNSSETKDSTNLFAKSSDNNKKKSSELAFQAKSPSNSIGSTPSDRDALDAQAQNIEEDDSLNRGQRALFALLDEENAHGDTQKQEKKVNPAPSVIRGNTGDYLELPSKTKKRDSAPSVLQKNTQDSLVVQNSEKNRKNAPFVIRGNTEDYTELRRNTEDYLELHFKLSGLLSGVVSFTNDNLLPLSTYIFYLALQLNADNQTTLSLSDLDLRSFMSQYQYQNYTFQADEVISFERAGRRQEVFVELDNRTENNRTQIQKILNYINYAFKHPNRDILMIISITDGSLPTNKVKKYTNVGRKLSNLGKTFLDAFIKIKDGEKQYLSSLYEKATNLDIILSGVSESHVDIAEFLLGSNYSLDYLNTIENYVAKLNEKSQWKVTFEPSTEFSAILDNPDLATNSLNDIAKLDDIQPVSTDIAKGIWRYVEINSLHPSLGKLHFQHKLSREKWTQTVIAGREHSLNTVLDINQAVSQYDKLNSIAPPVVVYPTKKHPVTPVVLKSFNEQFNLVYDHWRPNIPVMIAPLQTIDNNFELHYELHNLIKQHPGAFYSYFRIGAVNQASLKKGVEYGDKVINLLKRSFDAKPRSFDELHKLALKLNKKDFIKQLKLNEVPLGVYQSVFNRRPAGSYTLPVISKLPYLNEEIHQQKYDVFDYVYALDGVYGTSRTKLRIPYNENYI